MAEPVKLATRACAFCPYRKSAPSGLWVAEHYERLPGYDNETMDQPPAAFMCHKDNGNLCMGWVGCHDMSESLGLRLLAGTGGISPEDFETCLDYVSPDELWSSGTAAAEHGLRDVDDPGPEALKAMDALRGIRR